jgi:hypothetical protein
VLGLDVIPLSSSFEPAIPLLASEAFPKTFLAATKEHVQEGLIDCSSLPRWQTTNVTIHRGQYTMNKILFFLKKKHI